jgi:hypothetical protein
LAYLNVAKCNLGKVKLKTILASIFPRRLGIGGGGGIHLLGVTCGLFEQTRSGIIC